MATPKQIAANRRNSQKSTGPRSEDGKARSARNALKTGIEAKSMIIRGESKDDLDELTAEYYHHYRPATPAERMLVDTLIDCEWHLRRFRAIDTQLTEKAWHVFDITLGQVFKENCDVFARLQRRIDSTQRHYHNALRELRRLQSAEPEPPTTPATPTVQTPKAKNGFVPPTPPAASDEASGAEFDPLTLSRPVPGCSPEPR
ncbi:MAG TPA: hypothetical protein VMB03_02660 [Bryobacteraceae bacterium]|nr:hypothetical protein [Bryobacteraceae bacterium]